MRIKSILGLASLVMLLSTATNAAAEDVANSPSVVNIYASLGIDGSVSVEDAEEDLDSAFGLGLLYSRRLHENVLLGGSFSFLSWSGEDNGSDQDRNLLINAGLRPEGAFPVSTKVDLFVAGILGLTFSQLGDDNFGLAEIDAALGFHLGFALGTRVELGDGHGLQLELVFQRHQAEHEVETLFGGFDVDAELELGMLNLGYFFQ